MNSFRNAGNKHKMSDFVLDASALLALLNQEVGSEVVGAVISQTVISTVNLSEVIAKLADKGLPRDVITSALEGLGLEVVEFDQEQALTAGLLRSKTKVAGLSLGDRACLALAFQLGLPALTTDRIWDTLNLDIEVRVIR